MPMSWWFSRGWEEYFTVVQWDQRGAGHRANWHLLQQELRLPMTISITITASAAVLQFSGA